MDPYYRNLQDRAGLQNENEATFERAATAQLDRGHDLWLGLHCAHKV